MKIQHNIPAMNAYRNYTNNVSAVAKNLEKLSSGYRINRAGDDAAGLAISEKMRAQITGLETAQKNAKDGISLIQTAEGAMTEVHSMLNRMFELAEQSANGTYDNEVDRANLQKEFDALRAEIDRIADSSNFNGQKLLDGSLDATEGSCVMLDTPEYSATSPVPSTEGYLQGDLGVGGKTILQSKPTAAAPTTFGVNFGDYSFEGAIGDKLEMDIGGKKFTLEVVDTADVSATTGKIAAGTLDGAGIASAFASLIGATDTTFGESMKAEAAGNVLTFTQNAAPTTKDEVVEASYQVKLTPTNAAAGSSTSIVAGTFTASGENATAIATAVAGIVSVAGNVTAAGSADTSGLDLSSLSDKELVSTSGTDFKATSALTVEIRAAASGDKMELWVKDDDGAAMKLGESGAVTEIASASTANKLDIDFGTYGKIVVTGATASDTSGPMSVAALKTALTGTVYTGVSAAEKTAATGGGAAGGTYNTGTVVITQGSEAKTGGLASTVVDISSVAKDGGMIEIDGTQYVFQVGKDSQVTGTNLIDLTDFEAGDDGLLEAAAERLTDAAKGETKWAVGHQMGKAGIVTFTQIDANADFSTIEKVQDSIKFGRVADVVTAGKGSALTLQIGDTADSYNMLAVNVGDIHCKALGIDSTSINISEQGMSQTAMDAIKNAINMVSSTRGDLGALQNRLEHTINNLGVMQENIQDAEASIRDTDIAKEMMAYTKNNILVQASQAMLAQANQLPQGVLQLLG